METIIREYITLHLNNREPKNMLLNCDWVCVAVDRRRSILTFSKQIKCNLRLYKNYVDFLKNELNENHQPNSIFNAKQNGT